MSQLPQDVEEFISEFTDTVLVERDGGDDPTWVIFPEDLRAWMTGHVRVPVEMAEFALKCMRNDNNQTESFLCAIGGAGEPVPRYLLQERGFTDRLEAMLNASKGE